MAERAPIPTDADKVSWAEGGGAYPSGDPGAPKRSSGWQPKDNPVPGPGEVIPAEGHNFKWRVSGQMDEWIRDTIVREWRDVWEGIAQTDSAGIVFRVVPAPGTTPGTMYSRLQAAWSTASTAATGGNPVEIKTDGEQIYYIAGSANQSLIAASPPAGAEVWESSGIVIQFAALAVDGAAVYAMSTNAAEPGLFVINRTTGAQTANAGTEYACDFADANGVYWCGANGTVGGAGSLVFFTTAGPSQTGIVVPFLANATDLCLDDSTVFIVGPRNVDDVFAYTLSTRALLWSVKVDANAFTVNAICTDGDFIYVGTDSAALAAGGNASIFCLNKSNGAVLWTIDHSDVDELAVDDRYLYAVDSSNNLQMIRLRAPVPAIVGTATNFGTSIACDGYAVYGNDSFTVTNFRKVWCGGAAKEFMLVHPADTSRRPFFNLAVPVDGRI
jgi:hypothetical protein